MLPNFIIAGAAKSGSSTLYYYLNKHPEILMSKEKEPAYFTKYWGKKELKWYESQFDHWNGEKAIGEATVEYMVDEKAPERICKILPNVKLIFIMRNPVDRAWSHYWHRVKMGEETRSFDEIIKSIKNGNLNEYVIRYGMYATHIKRFLKYFPREKMLFLLLEEFKENPIEHLKLIFKFLEVDDSVEISYEGKKNSAKMYRSKTLSILWAKIRKMDGLKEKIPNKVYNPLRRAFQYIDKLNKKPFTPPPLNEAYKEFLHSIFENEIKELQKIINKDLAHVWKI